MKKGQILMVILISLVVSLASSVVTGFTLVNKFSAEPTNNQLVKEFYEVENAVMVSPHGLRKSMDKGKLNMTLVDLRSKQEYEKEHIVGAINIPAYSNPDTSAYDDVERIVSSFKKLPKDKDIVVYCYSMPCMTGRKIGLMLAKNNIYVKHLGVGWNEWRHFWTLWNHEHEWDITDVKNYVISGKDPGTPKTKESDTLTPCSESNEFGC